MQGAILWGAEIKKISGRLKTGLNGAAGKGGDNFFL